MDYVNTAALEFITGKRDLDADWDAYVKDCENKGSQKYVDEANESIKIQRIRLKNNIHRDYFRKDTKNLAALAAGFLVHKKKKVKI